MKKVSVGIVFFRGEKYLPFVLRSLAEQDYPAIEFLFRDQSPNGEVREWVRENLPDFAEKFEFELGENLFHSGGQNALIERATGDFYFCGSNDIFYPPDFFSKLVAGFEACPRAGFAMPKLRQWDFEMAGVDFEKSLTDRLDSCGIGISRGHRFFDIGQNEVDRGQFDGVGEVFGASGAAMFFRRATLDKIRFEGEFFDPQIHYKNDVDLSYRLRWAGKKCVFLPGAVAWHDRQLSGSEENIFQARRRKSSWEKSNSFFGQLAVLRKNFSPKFSWRTRVCTAVRGFLMRVFVLIFEREILPEIRRFAKLRGEFDRRAVAILKKNPGKIEKFMK